MNGQLRLLAVVGCLILIVISTTSCMKNYMPTSAGSPDNALISKMKEKTFIVLLGTGTPNPDPLSQGPSLAVIVKDAAYLVDCGPGIVRRAAAAYNAGINALAPDRLEKIFITHLHTDHTAGFPDLIFTPWVMGRPSPLQVYGPAGLKNMTDHLLEAYKEDIRVRLEGLEPANETGYKIIVNEASPGIIYMDENVEVTAFAAKHGMWESAYGYRFKTPDLDICISGDTTYYPEMISNYKGCDILIHEVYCEKAWQERTPEWRAYHKEYHTSAVDLGKVASEVNPSMLVLIHQLRWNQPESEIIKEISLSYSGKIIYGKDLMMIGVTYDPEVSPPKKLNPDNFHVVRLDLMNK